MGIERASVDDIPLFLGGLKKKKDFKIGFELGVLWHSQPKTIPQNFLPEVKAYALDMGYDVYHNFKGTNPEWHCPRNYYWGYSYAFSAICLLTTDAREVQVINENTSRFRMLLARHKLKYTRERMGETAWRFYIRRQK